MINPELQVDPETWTEYKPIDYEKNSEPIVKYPDLVTYLQKAPWRIMSGHSCTNEYMEKFRKKMTLESEKVRCTIHASRNFVKLILLSPIEYSTIQVGECLMVKVPFIKEKIKKTVSAETLEKITAKPVVAKPKEILKNYAGYEGSLIGNLSDEEILTDFEIEETTEMVQEWIRKGWYVPPSPPKRMVPTLPKQNDQPIVNKVKVDNKPKPKSKPKRRWPSPNKSNQCTQTKSWAEILKNALDDEKLAERLSSQTDTEYDSEDTVISA